MVNLSRGLRAKQEVPRAGDIGQAEQGGRGRQGRGSEGAYTSRAPSRDDLAQRLQRVFGIDIKTCSSCDGPMRIIACIEEPAVIEKLFSHLVANAPELTVPAAPPVRTPPQRELFDETG